MRNYLPFALVVGIYVATLVAIGVLLQPQKLNTVKHSFEQDIARWDSIIDTISIDSNAIPSSDPHHMALAVLDDESIRYVSPKLSNQGINDSTYDTNTWSIYRSTYGLYLRKYQVKEDLILFVEVNLRKVWPDLLDYLGDSNIPQNDHRYWREAFAHREGFVLSSSAPGTAHIEFVLDSTDSEDQMYISRLDGNFWPNTSIRWLGAFGVLWLLLLFLLCMHRTIYLGKSWWLLVIPTCMLFAHMMLWVQLFGGIFPSIAEWGFSEYSVQLNIICFVCIAWLLVIQLFMAYANRLKNLSYELQSTLWEALHLASFVLLVFVLRSTIFGSTEPFAFDNMARVNASSVLIAICAFLMVYCMYRILTKLVNLRSQSISQRYAWLRFLPYGVFLAIMLYSSPFYLLLLMIVSIATVKLTELALQRENMMLSILVFVAGFALFTAVYGDLIQKHKWVNWLENSNDASWSAYSEEIERSFSLIDSQVVNDAYLSNPQMFMSPISEEQIAQRIKRKYFKGIWSMYMIDAFLYNPNELSGTSERERLFCDLFDSLENAEPNTSFDNLYRINQEDRPSYIMLFHLNREYGAKSLLLHCVPQYSSSNQRYLGHIYDTHHDSKALEAVYSEGFYTLDTLSHKRGAFNFPKDVGDIDQWQASKQNLSKKTSLDNGDIILQHIISTSWYDVASYASYLFFLFSVAFGILEGLSWLAFRLNRHIANDNEVQYTSYRRRIIGSVLGLVVVSFVLISAISILNFSIRRDDYHKDRLIRKTQAIRSAVEFKLGNLGVNGDTTTSIQLLNENDLKEIAAIHGLDIDVYDAEGLISTSSEYQIIMDRLVDIELPQKFRSTLKDQEGVLVKEDTLLRNECLSSFTALRTSSGEVLGYIHIPYFDRSESDVSELSEFLLSLVNIYAIVLLLAAFITHAIARRLTQPIEALVERMQSVQSLDQNEGLKWERNDEFGRLVSAYNSLLIQVEEGARRLARNERENTWRQIAKQIAHEIKNPLTPMKLNLQHLSTIRKDNEADYQERVNHLSKSLLSQIDNLTAIVDAFSAFSQMPKANAESFDMGQLVKEIVALFGHHKGVRLECEEDEGIILSVFADRNHFVSVLNNLIKNAIQACEQKNTEVDVLVRLSREDKFVRVDVIDQGIGIAGEDKINVFVPNFTTKTTGSGLGLAIARQIIENVEGSIGFVSEEGEGSTFYFLVPLQQV